MKEEVQELSRACQLNMAACYLQLREFHSTRRACEGVLHSDPTNLKALYRKAQAEMGLTDYREAVVSLRKLLKQDEKNDAARKMLQEALACKKEAASKRKRRCGG